MSSKDATNGGPPALEMDQDCDSDGDDWSEDANDDAEPTRCLFCEEISSSIESAIKHLRVKHYVDLLELKRKFLMDCYSYIKMINYIRINKSQDSEFHNVDKPFWDDKKYLKPGDYEPWLTFDFESFGENIAGTREKHQLVYAFDDFESMKTLVLRLEDELKDKNTLLQQAAKDISTMQSNFQNLIENEPNSQTTDTKSKELANGVGSIPLDRDSNYFSSYSHYGIHHEMLSDEVRTSSYRDALLGNAEFFKGKTVLDVGCGTSILSMFASKAGAEVVVAVDNSDIIYQAMEISKTNNFDNIKFVKGRLEDSELPIDKFDVIVSEWMGYFLIFEGMLDSIIYARDKHLKLGGALLPNRCNISIVGHGDEARHQHYISYWENVYGFDMSCMQQEVLREAMIDVAKPEFVLTESVVIVDYDLMKVDVNYSNFSFDFNLLVVKDGRMTSIVGYFDTFFDLPNKVWFSTSPGAKTTHWKQVTFFFKDPVDVKKNDEVKGRITCKRSVRDKRSLTVRIKIFDKDYTYYLD